jgi:hypothetical protein
MMLYVVSTITSVWLTNDTQLSLKITIKVNLIAELYAFLVFVLRISDQHNFSIAESSLHLLLRKTLFF